MCDRPDHADASEDMSRAPLARRMGPNLDWVAAGVSQASSASSIKALQSAAKGDWSQRCARMRVIVRLPSSLQHRRRVGASLLELDDPKAKATFFNSRL